MIVNLKFVLFFGHLHYLLFNDHTWDEMQDAVSLNKTHTLNCLFLHEIQVILVVHGAFIIIQAHCTILRGRKYIYSMAFSVFVYPLHRLMS